MTRLDEAKKQYKEACLSLTRAAQHLVEQGNMQIATEILAFAAKEMGKIHVRDLAKEVCGAEFKECA